MSNPKTSTMEARFEELGWLNDQERKKKQHAFINQELKAQKEDLIGIHMDEMVSLSDRRFKEGKEANNKKWEGIMEAVIGYIGDDEERKLARNRLKTLQEAT